MQIWNAAYEPCLFLMNHKPTIQPVYSQTIDSHDLVLFSESNMHSIASKVLLVIEWLVWASCI